MTSKSSFQPQLSVIVQLLQWKTGVEGMMVLKYVAFLLCPNIEVWNCDDKAHSNSFMNTEFLRRVIFLLSTG